MIILFKTKISCNLEFYPDASGFKFYFSGAIPAFAYIFLPAEKAIKKDTGSIGARALGFITTFFNRN